MKKFKVVMCAMALLCAMLATGFSSEDGKGAILVVSFGTATTRAEI